MVIIFRQGTQMTGCSGRMISEIYHVNSNAWLDLENGSEVGTGCAIDLDNGDNNTGPVDIHVR